MTAYLLHNGSAKGRGRRRAQAARRRRSESESEQGAFQSPAADPKPGDLAMEQVEGRVTPTGGPHARLLKKSAMTCG